MTQLGEYRALRTELLEQPVAQPPSLTSNHEPHGTVSLGELIDAEAVTVYEAPLAVGAEESGTPMLSAKDVRLGRAASRLGSATAPGAITVRTGDIAVVVSTESAVRVCDQDGVLLGPGITLLRPNSNAVDPYFLAGVLRAAADAGEHHGDLYQVPVPRFTPAEQRRYGAAFTQLSELEAAWHRQRAGIERLVRVGFDGLARGRLQPATADE